MRWRRNILLLFITLASSSFGQFCFPPTGARSAAMGGCGTALNDVESATINIASIARQRRSQVALSYRNEYLQTKLSYKSLTATYTIKKSGSLMAHYTHYGSTTYNEQQAMLGYALPVSQKLSLGVGVDYLHSGASIAGYSENLLTCSLGLQFYPTERLTLGTSVFNPLFVKSSSTIVEMRIPVDFRVGIAYRILQPLLATVEVEKNIYETAALRCGLEYTYNSWLSARVGMSTQPMNLTFGAGVNRSHYAIDLALQYHTILGLTPHLSLLYQF